MSINITIIDETERNWDLPVALITDLQISNGKNGPRSVSFTMPVSFRAAMALYPNLLGDDVRISWFSDVFFRGRIEDLKITSTGLTITAFGYWNAIDDNLYTALWSTTDYSLWHPVTNNELSNRTPDKYNFDFNNRIYISTKKGLTYGNSYDIGGAVIKIPYGSNRKIIGFSCDFAINLPNPSSGVSWELIYVRFNEGFAAGAATVITTTSGTLFFRSVHYVIAACDYLELAIYNNTGANSTPAGDDGANFVSISNLRVVTTTTNRVNTTLSINFAAGIATPVSMVGIYVGQRIIVNNANNTSESNIVTAITATTFSIALSNAHVAGESITAFAVYADEIVKDVLAANVAQNSTQLSASTVLIQAPQVDLTDYIYEDERSSKILNDLALIPDNQTTPSFYVVGVNTAKMLYFQPKIYDSRTYYIDIADFETIITLENIYNSIYALYLDGKAERILRTVATTDLVSIARYGLTRTNFVNANTTNSTLASNQRNALLTDQKDAQAKASITVNRIFNSIGGEVPLSQPKSGDVIVIRNFPSTLVSDTVIDRIKSFTILETNYDVLNQSLSVVPEDFVLSLELLLRKLR